VEEDLF